MILWAQLFDNRIFSVTCAVTFVNSLSFSLPLSFLSSGVNCRINKCGDSQLYKLKFIVATDLRSFCLNTKCSTNTTSRFFEPSSFYYASFLEVEFLLSRDFETIVSKTAARLTWNCINGPPAILWGEIFHFIPYPSVKLFILFFFHSKIISTISLRVKFWIFDIYFGKLDLFCSNGQARRCEQWEEMKQ